MMHRLKWKHLLLVYFRITGIIVQVSATASRSTREPEGRTTRLQSDWTDGGEGLGTLSLGVLPVTACTRLVRYRLFVSEACKDSSRQLSSFQSGHQRLPVLSVISSWLFLQAACTVR